MSAAVVVCLDRNKLVEQESGPPLTHFYEEEAVRCVASWRRAARWKGPVYAVQYKGREVSDRTAGALHGLGADITTMPLPPVKRPFMEVVYALQSAEAGDFLGEDRILYSDLDVTMKAPPPPEFLKPGQTMLYYYRSKDERGSSPEFAHRMGRAAALGFRCHNTYFQAFDRGRGFQKAVRLAASSPEYGEFFRENVYYAPTDDDYFFEEGAYDYVCMRRGAEFGVEDLPCPGGFFEHVHAHRQVLG